MRKLEIIVASLILLPMGGTRIFGSVEKRWG